MRKIVIVALLGGLSLLAFLFLRGRQDRSASAASGPGIAPTVASPQPAQPTAPAAPTPATVATGDPEACRHLADLCSTSDQKVDPDACAKQLADARKMAGPGNVERSERCMAEAATCAAATGCLSGGVGMGAMGEYLKGFGAALSH